MGKKPKDCLRHCWADKVNDDLNKYSHDGATIADSIDSDRLRSVVVESKVFRGP